MKKVFAVAIASLAVGAGFASTAPAATPAARTACATGYHLAYIGPASMLGKYSKYDHNGDSYVCLAENGQKPPAHDNHL